MNIPMFWITLDLVELYYSGLPLRQTHTFQGLCPRRTKSVQSLKLAP